MNQDIGRRRRIGFLGALGLAFSVSLAPVAPAQEAPGQLTGLTVKDHPWDGGKSVDLSWDGVEGAEYKIEHRSEPMEGDAAYRFTGWTEKEYDFFERKPCFMPNGTMEAYL